MFGACIITIIWFGCCFIEYKWASLSLQTIFGLKFILLYTRIVTTLWSYVYLLGIHYPSFYPRIPLLIVRYVFCWQKKMNPVLQSSTIVLKFSLGTEIILLRVVLEHWIITSVIFLFCGIFLDIFINCYVIVYSFSLNSWMCANKFQKHIKKIIHHAASTYANQ